MLNNISASQISKCFEIVAFPKFKNPLSQYNYIKRNLLKLLDVDHVEWSIGGGFVNITVCKSEWLNGEYVTYKKHYTSLKSNIVNACNLNTR